MNSRHCYLFAVGILLALSLSSCTKTVTETQFDTTTVIKTVRDTVSDTVGLAHIRFVSMFPPSFAPNINIIQADTHTVWTVASFTCPNSYLLLPRDTPTTLFAQISSINGWFKFMPLPKFGPNYITWALFLSDSDLVPTWSIDSEKFTPPPNGQCYVRIINGVTDASWPLQIDIDDTSHPLKNASGQTLLTPNFSISDYALCPVGQHEILLVADNPNDPNPETDFTLSPLLESGKYYTILATGTLANHTGMYRIDEEQ